MWLAGSLVFNVNKIETLEEGTASMDDLPTTNGISKGCLVMYEGLME